MRHLILSLLFSLFIVPAFAQYEDPTPEELRILEQLQADTIPGQTGVISLDVANCTLKVPEGFVFLDKEASKHLIVDYWNNPDESADEIIGTLVNDYAGYFYNVDIAYIIMYDDSGYVSDEDANSIDYDELLKSLQDELKEENKNNPYETQWELLDWAWQPTYDSQKKVLGWAKHFRIDGEREVINYDIRVLGKSGFVLIKAVADPEFKEQVMADNEAIINSVEYNEVFGIQTLILTLTILLNGLSEA